MICNLPDIFSVRSNNSSIIVISQIQDRQYSSRSPTCDLRGIIGQCKTSDNSIIIGLENILSKIHLPYSQQLIFSSSNAEA